LPKEIVATNPASEAGAAGAALDLEILGGQAENWGGPLDRGERGVQIENF